MIDADHGTWRSPLAWAQAAGPVARGTVLVVDDEPSTLTVTRRMLERIGFHAIPAATGFEALELVPTIQPDLSLVLLDLTMPGKSGLETYQDLKVLSPRVPVVFMSGYTAEALSRTRLGPSPVGFLPKPFTLDQLELEVNQALAG